MKTKLLALTLCLLAYQAYACTAFKTGEQVSGMNKLCYYDHLGSTFVLTVKNYQLCPLTVQAPH